MRNGLPATGYWLLARKNSGFNSSQLPAASGQLANARTRARGFSLVAALFLVVVVAALGVFAVRVGMAQQQTVNLALLGARALAAANSGIEYGAYRALTDSVCAPATLNMSEAGLNGFTVNVTCSDTSHSESGGSVTVYRIEALATYGTYGQPDYVSRRVFATFASEP